RLPVAGTKQPSEARVKTLAYLLGDGHTKHRNGKARARFYNSNPEIIADYRAAVTALGATTKTYRHAKTGVVTVTCTSKTGDRNPISALVEAVCLVHRAEDKRVPEEVFQYTETALRFFLGTLWSTDGS